MGSVTEGTQELNDGFEVYTKTWKPSGSPKGRILFVHGFSDHCNNYEELFPFLSSHGLEIYGFDQRGWGRSAPKKSQRGDCGDTTQVLADITTMLQTILPSPVPVFLMGHSMGGAEVLTYLSLDPANLCSKLRGVISLAPLIALHPRSKPWRVTVMAGKMAAKVLPRFQLVNKLDPQWLSHDEAKNRDWNNDPLCHDTCTLLSLEHMLDRAEKLDTGAWTIGEGKNEGGKTRVLVLHGDEDNINDFVGSERYVRESISCQDKELKRYQGFYHNMHVENTGVTYETFREDVWQWIEARLDIRGQSSAQSAKL